MAKPVVARLGILQSLELLIAIKPRYGFHHFALVLAIIAQLASIVGSIANLSAWQVYKGAQAYQALRNLPPSLQDAYNNAYASSYSAAIANGSSVEEADLTAQGAGLAAQDAADSSQNGSGQIIEADALVGASSSKSVQTSATVTPKGDTIAANGLLTVLATGGNGADANNGNITATGATITAATLAAIV